MPRPKTYKTPEERKAATAANAKRAYLKRHEDNKRKGRERAAATAAAMSHEERAAKNRKQQEKRAAKREAAGLPPPIKRTPEERKQRERERNRLWMREYWRSLTAEEKAVRNRRAPLTDEQKAAKRIYSRARRAANLERERARNRKFGSENRDYFRERCAARRARKLQATPSWSSTHNIKLVYQMCPPDMEVDHIYPLQSDWVCGLHVETNLQYLPRIDNIRKGNRYSEQYHGS